MKNCVTHHHACDCREDKFKKLEEKNKKLRECLVNINALGYMGNDNQGKMHRCARLCLKELGSKK